MKGIRDTILRKIEGYMKFKGISRQELAKKWNKTEAYICRRLSGTVELDLADIIELCRILELTEMEAVDIFFNRRLRNT